MKNTCAVVVTYNPDLKLLKKVLSVLYIQVNRIYIIDNCSRTDVGSSLNSNYNISGTFLKNNIGIAAAYNIGLNIAKDAGFEYVMLLDQDSIPSTDMVSNLYGVMEELSCLGVRVASVGPRCKDPRSSHIARFVCFKWFHFKHCSGNINKPIVPVDFLISSGSLYKLTVFDTVGLFNEDLFIDHVDTEWFHRARHYGFKCFGVWNTIMEHSLGESILKISVFGSRFQPIHKPFRLYYIVRNSILIYRMPHSPIKWISGDLVRLLRLMIIYVLFQNDRKEYMINMFKGLIDGLLGKKGPLK